jgi:ketosteroid isomerase-like protein
MIERPLTALLASAALAALAPFASAAEPASQAALQEQVAAAERAFAKTMADRDFAAFQQFLADETVFFGGPDKVNRGKQAVAAAWKAFYDGPSAPFSWAPESVEVLASGTLAHSSGPVRDPSGKLIGQFNSIWRLESPGTWRVVFDKGCEVCQECARAEKPQG